MLTEILIESTLPTVPLPSSLQRRWISKRQSFLSINTHILYALSLALKAPHTPHLHLLIQSWSSATHLLGAAQASRLALWLTPLSALFPPVFLLPARHLLKSILAFKTQLHCAFLSTVYPGFLTNSISTVRLVSTSPKWLLALAMWLV